MRFEISAFIGLLAIGASASPMQEMQGDDNSRPDRNIVSVEKICGGLNTMDHGCIRYTRGFDVTGVVTEVDLTFPQVRSACDCIQECLDRPLSCASYVYKFSTPASIMSGHRTCTLYSQFNLPTNVTIEVDVNTSVDIQLLQPGNNPQMGAPVPQTFKDLNNTIPDDGTFSGPVWQLMNGVAQC